jgi:hypothetical protein
MLRTISLKALIVSNIAHWLFLAGGMICVMALYYAGLTIESDGTSSSAVIWAQMKSSPALIYLTALSSVIAPIPAGYIAAKIARHAKLLNGALSTSAWLLFDLYIAICGTGGGSEFHIPYLLDFLTSYGVVIPALAGAYVAQIRASLSAGRAEARAPTGIQQREGAMAPTGSTPTKSRMTRPGGGLVIFIFIISQILLTKHERNVMLFALIALIAFLLVATFVSKAVKKRRSLA